MTYMEINSVNYDDLDNQSLVDWLQEHEGEGFVLITDGDNSLQRDFNPVVLSLEEVLEEVSPNESIVFAEDAPQLDGFTRGKSYWSHSMLTMEM